MEAWVWKTKEKFYPNQIIQNKKSQTKCEILENYSQVVECNKQHVKNMIENKQESSIIRNMPKKFPIL